MKILEAKIVFDDDGKIEKVIVLAEASKNDIRAIAATRSKAAGYFTIPAIPGPSVITLLQDTADYGIEVDAADHFPKSKHLKR